MTSAAYVEFHVSQPLATVTWRLSIPVPVAITSYGKFINWYLSFVSQFLELYWYDLAQGTRSARPQTGEHSVWLQMALSEGPFGGQPAASFGGTTPHHLMATLNLLTFPS